MPIKPQVYYGLHMAPGLASYQEPQINEGRPYCILVDEQAIKNMDASFKGCPVYVHHVDEVNLDKIREEADGYVIRSFYNQLDGKHWVEFIVVSEKGQEAINVKHWKLSNAYIPKEFAGGGVWHGMDYVKEVVKGEYEHLAIVPNPRYSESVILTPDEFKSYNEAKDLELKRLANSKGADEMPFNFFKKTKVENSGDLSEMSVMLPKSKQEVAVTKLINDADEMAMNQDKPQMCNGEHSVMVGDEKMTVNDLVKKHMELKASMQPDEGGEEIEKEDMKNEDKKEEDEKKPEPEVKKNHFETLKNAHKKAKADQVIELGVDKVARGKARYGSGN